MGEGKRGQGGRGRGARMRGREQRKKGRAARRAGGRTAGRRKGVRTRELRGASERRHGGEASFFAVGVLQSQPPPTSPHPSLACHPTPWNPAPARSGSRGLDLIWGPWRSPLHPPRVTAPVWALDSPYLLLPAISGKSPQRTPVPET